MTNWLRDQWLMHMDLWPWAGVANYDPANRMDYRSSRRDMNDMNPEEPPSSQPPDYHEPVLLKEVLHFLKPSPGKLILDATLGGGGHTEQLLKAGAHVIGLDQDTEALAFAGQRLRHFGNEFIAIQSNFRHFAEILTETGITGLDGLLADVGVSSHQLDDASRGFSFMQDGPLDMRMNQGSGRSAADFVNEDSAEELARIIFEYGEEKASRRIARAIVERRALKPFTTTLELAQCVESVIPRHGKKHPATRVFQALRIAVNDELGALTTLLREAPKWMKPGGRIVLIGFHSMEDRLIKQSFAGMSTEWLDRPEWPSARPNPACCLRLLTKKPVEASPEELERNPRARSARLRAAEKLQKLPV
jgi:16S rRNA (cytosine1402-N4)-methyltransferase